MGRELINELFQVPFEYLGEFMQGKVDTMIGDPPLRIIIGADPHL